MAQRLKVCRSVLLLGVFLTASYGYGEESRNNKAPARLSLKERESLAASIPRRELELAVRSRKEVLAEVKKRIQELKLTASADQLTSLLEQRAHLEIAIDKCRAAGESCWADEATMDDVEASFRQKTGISTSEFRSGRRDTSARDAERARVAGQSATTKAYNDTCTCALSVYSLNRWMNRYWGLECNNHASHGVCSNNVDSAHTPGTGAMTGDIDLYFGSHHAHRDCPDDQRTCFKGPSTDHVGSWGNACNCDTWHSQYYNPSIAWYGGDLADSAQVDQLHTGYMSVAGACNEVSVSVKEFIQENDPWCCDDPMGDLWVTLPLANGSGTVDGAASTQNCNGGSQSGAYPYCGTFGATIRVAYVCSTYTPPPPPECDPLEEQSCFDLGGTWNSTNCSCNYRDPWGCDPVAEQNCYNYGGYWNSSSCLCEL